MKQITAANKTIDLYDDGHPAPDTPIVFLYVGEEGAGTVWEETRSRTDKPFCLAVIPVEDWENELSPWAAPKVFKGGRDFGSGGDETLRALEDTIVPQVKQALGCPESPCYLAGYSLAGLLVVYGLYRTGCFAGGVSASGSLWFPGCLDYAASHQFLRQPQRVYFSLGDRESLTRNPVMAKVEENTQAVYESFLARGIDCVFERNPGNHFQDAEVRLAKGIAWILNR